MSRTAATLSLLLCPCVPWPAAAADNRQVVESWPGKSPDETGGIGPEMVCLSPKLIPKEVEVTDPTRILI